MTGDTPSSPEYEDYGRSHTHRKKRVGKACDLCRIKKTKCDGKKPCNKCIADNKICVFTEKKKSKDRNHPLGYVELLETRIDLLLKLLEKLVALSTPHLQFLQELNQLENGGLIPINKVVLYLITKEGLLKNLPVDWENGAMIAANLPSDREGISRASREFAEHLKNLESYADVAQTASMMDAYDDAPNSGFNSVAGQSLNSANRSSSSLTTPTTRGGDFKIKSEYEDAISPPMPPKVPTRTNLSESMHSRPLISHTKRPSISAIFESSGSDFSNPPTLTMASIAAANDMFSLLEFDLSNEQELLPPKNIFDSFDDDRPPSMFPQNNSMTSLTNKFEDHVIKLPSTNTSLNSVTTNANGTTILRLLLVSRAMLPQLKATGHIQKPVHSHSHSHSHSHINASGLLNSKNDFRFNRINSNSLLLTPTPENYQPANESPSEFMPFSLNDEYSNSDALPLLAFLAPGYDHLGIVDTTNNESFIVSNPFLRR